MRASVLAIARIAAVFAPSVATALAVFAGAASAEPKALRATFLGDATYTIGDKGCMKLKALAAGAPRNLGTVPETLDASGFHSWEGGCSFTAITEVRKGRLYKARLACAEAAEEWVEDDTFTVADGGATVTVIVKGKDAKKTVFQRCAVPAAARQK